MSNMVPQGYIAAGVYSGVKRNASRLDLALIVSDRAATAAGVYTRNLFAAAPVRRNRQRTPSDTIRAVVVNSGNANACTGDRGDQDAHEMARLAGLACGVDGRDVLVMSTGVIGEPLPMEKIKAGVAAAAEQLAANDESFDRAARGMMTTDTVPKIAHVEVPLQAGVVRIFGMCKGAAMIGPNMATMLALVLTDAALEPAAAQSLLAAAVDESFNCISVDGHMSTNDSVILLANGASGVAPHEGRDLINFQTALGQLCEDLARAIPSDGEGATHLVTIEVHGCRTRSDARQIAKTIANSPLVKTAIAGADPNWGRIVSAAGYAGVAFDTAAVSLHVNGLLLYERGAPSAFDAAAVSSSIRDNRDTSIVFLLAEGSESARFWTTDLTTEYVRLNADYHT